VELGHPAFQGHFPGRPILSGLLQLDWAIRLGKETFGPLGAFQGVEHLKFQSPIGPSEPVVLSLAWDAALRHLAFQYGGAQGPKSAGTVVFAPQP
jgi:3-hydroxymyristoyl/3-hydroxydecanoyl-(acyl carrier protein) dehydratase